MVKKSEVFRKVSLERLSSPEQLDSLMSVTSPRGWLALVALGLLLVFAILWGFFGTLSIKVISHGVLIVPGGLQTVFAISNGQISDIALVENDFVQKGDTLARIEQPLILDQLKQAGAGLKSAQSTDKEALIASLREDYANASRVVSPYTGRVLEVMAKKGETVNIGSPLFSIESVGSNSNKLEVVMYFPLHDGKRISPGMNVEISPSSVNKEEFGFMMGEVTSVSEFPITEKGMLVKIGNEALVKEFVGQGSAMLEVRVELIPDSSTISGYKWSTGSGPPVQINSGTLVSGSVTIKKQKPITSVIPQIK